MNVGVVVVRRAQGFAKELIRFGAVHGCPVHPEPRAEHKGRMDQERLDNVMAYRRAALAVKGNKDVRPRTIFSLDDLLLLPFRIFSPTFPACLRCFPCAAIRSQAFWVLLSA
jgi:hypothetical protein